MKRIHNATMLAAILAFSSPSQAQVNPPARARVHLEDALAPVQPNALRLSDPTEQAQPVGLDYTQESRLNDRQRGERRHRARTFKEQARAA